MSRTTYLSFSNRVHKLIKIIVKKKCQKLCSMILQYYFHFLVSRNKIGFSLSLLTEQPLNFVEQLRQSHFAGLEITLECRLSLWKTPTLPLLLLPSPHSYLELNGCAPQCIFLPVSIMLRISEHPAKQFPEFLSLSGHFQVTYVLFLFPLFHKVSLRSRGGPGRGAED